MTKCSWNGCNFPVQEAHEMAEDALRVLREQGAGIGYAKVALQAIARSKDGLCPLCERRKNAPQMSERGKRHG